MGQGDLQERWGSADITCEIFNILMNFNKERKKRKITQRWLTVISGAMGQTRQGGEACRSASTPRSQPQLHWSSGVRKAWSFLGRLGNASGLVL